MPLICSARIYRIKDQRKKSKCFLKRECIICAHHKIRKSYTNTKSPFHQYLSLWVSSTLAILEMLFVVNTLSLLHEECRHLQKYRICRQHLASCLCVLYACIHENFKIWQSETVHTATWSLLWSVMGFQKALCCSYIREVFSPSSSRAYQRPVFLHIHNGVSQK